MMAAIERKILGSRQAHSTRQESTICDGGAPAHSRPKSFIDSAISQKWSTGL